MPRTTLLYLAAVLLPCGVLAWLGWRSAEQEAAAAQARRIAAWQQAADAAAQRGQAHMERRAREFGDAVESLAARADRMNPERAAAWLETRSPGASTVFFLDAASNSLQWAGEKPEIAAAAERFLRGEISGDCALVAFGEPPAQPEAEALQIALQDAGEVRGFRVARGAVPAEAEPMAADEPLAGAKKEMAEAVELMSRGRLIEPGAVGANSAPPGAAPAEPQPAMADAFAGGTAAGTPDRAAEAAAAPASPPAPMASGGTAAAGRMMESYSIAEDKAAPAPAPVIADADELQIGHKAKKDIRADAEADREKRGEPMDQKPASKPAAPLPAAAPKVAMTPPPPAPITAAREPQKAGEDLVLGGVTEDAPAPGAVPEEAAAGAVRWQDHGIGDNILKTENQPAARFREEQPADEKPAPVRLLDRALAPLHPTPGQPAASSVPLVPLRFPEITGASRGGIVSRMDGDTLSVLFWHRPSWQPGLIAGVLMDPALLMKELQSALAYQDDAAALRVTGQHGADGADRALVAREIGPALPRWEAALFLTNPAALAAAGNSARWQLALSLLAVMAAGVAGAVLLLRDTRRTALDARQKVDFVSSVSHELKTPLTSIRMFSDLLASQPDAPAEKRQRYARTIAAEAARLSRLIGNVLNFARLERGAHRLNPERLDVRDLCTRTLESLAPALEQDGFSVAVMLPEEPVMLHADQDAVSQILVNLLSNAQKYGQRPDGPREIALTLSATPEHVLLSVADRGPGVPAGQEEKIFRQFHRADDAMSSGASGTGLGLTISRGLAKAHGGTLTCAPREGGGAVFRLALPHRPASALS